MGEPALSAQDIEIAMDKAKAYSSIWLITRRTEFDPKDGLKKALSTQRTLEKTWTWLGVKVHRFR